MANIRKILEYRDKITDAVNMLIRLDNEHYPLLELEELNNILSELEKNCQPADVIIDIVEDNDYLQHRNLYAVPLKPLFACEFGVGCAKVDGVKFDWWDGLNDRLERQGCGENEIREYTEVTNRVTSFIKESLRALRCDLGGIGLAVNCTESTEHQDGKQSVGNRSGTELDEHDILLRMIFGIYSSKFLEEAKRLKKGADVARLVNWYVREYELEKSERLNSPLREALRSKGIQTASKATWNSIICNK